MKTKNQNNGQINDLNKHDTIAREDTANNRQHMRDLDASKRGLEYISYSISHDLRASLRSIDGFSHALLKDYADIFDSTAKEYLQIIRTSTQQMGQLIDNIIDLSRLSRVEIHPDKVDLSKLANEAVEDLKHNQPDSDVIFVIAEQIVAYCDENLMKLVFQYLIDNAFKYTSRQSQAIIEFGASDSDGDKAYFVRDNSNDIDKKYDNKIFKSSPKNYQSEKFTDTGVGLAVVQLMINRLGGRVWVEKNSGQGVTFYFTIDCG